jgi:hypothetical protein
MPKRAVSLVHLLWSLHHPSPIGALEKLNGFLP